MKTFEHQPTADSDLFRVVDRHGDWTHYYHAPSKRYLRAVNAILEAGYAKGPRFYDWLKNKNAQEVEEILKSSGERGDAIHQFISFVLSLRGEREIDRTVITVNTDQGPRLLSDDEWLTFLTFRTFWQEHKATIIATEQAVYNLKEGYAGTLDAILRLNKKCGFEKCKCKNFIGKVGLFDWKTGSGIYPNYGAQVASYAKGDNLPCKPQYTAILRIGTRHTSGYEFQPYDVKQTREHFKDFQSALRLAGESDFDAVKEIYEIPDSFTMDLTPDRILKSKEAA